MPDPELSALTERAVGRAKLAGIVEEQSAAEYALLSCSWSVITGSIDPLATSSKPDSNEFSVAAGNRPAALQSFRKDKVGSASCGTDDRMFVGRIGGVWHVLR